MKFALLASGFILLIIQNYIQQISAQTQFIIFITGISLIGIPHGAADLLVATQNTGNEKVLSKSKFFINYLMRLVLFSAALWFFPLIGTLLFIIFAAFHFGETDLHQYEINNVQGTLFVVSYGLVILGVILLNHAIKKLT